MAVRTLARAKSMFESNNHHYQNQLQNQTLKVVFNGKGRD